ncbi:hypothetical protein HNY73_000642 [Argiope bruennichi]|uniref:Uncharacterized protein n=1 Tax=Argiope bruennichi TaxID=94029 RepID=A0A8T0G157_ARGBR|nr:hypothetical protein HNY73_000642 [Argiope bruennichi]
MHEERTFTKYLHLINQRSESRRCQPGTGTIPTPDREPGSFGKAPKLIFPKKLPPSNPLGTPTSVREKFRWKWQRKWKVPVCWRMWEKVPTFTQRGEEILPAILTAGASLAQLIRYSLMMLLALSTSYRWEKGPLCK